MVNIDRFNLLLFSMVLLVVLVVGTSQYRQFQLTSVAVDQNMQIYRALLDSITEFREIENKTAANNIRMLGDATVQHGVILDFIKQNTLNSREQLKRLGEHINATAANLNLTRVNHDYLRDTNRVVHEIMEEEKNGSSSCGGAAAAAAAGNKLFIPPLSNPP